MQSIKKANIKDKTILLRVDFNVTLDPNGKIIDDIKIASTLPTINYLLKNNAKKIIIVSHFGRPILKGATSIEQVMSGNRGLKLAPIAKNLAEHLGMKLEPTIKNSDFFLPSYKISDQIYLMENIRFAAGEEKNDILFSKQLSKLADVYVDDAFGNAHRAHASMVGVTKYLPSYAGLLMEKEVSTLGELLKKPPKPFVLIMGGAKTSEKIQTLKKLVKKANKILLGGVMANTFLAGRDINMKYSTVDEENIDLANELYTSSAGKFYLPTDLVWKNGNIAVDIGKGTVEQFKKIIATAKTIFWNGTMGLTSMGNYKYSLGTREIIQAIADSPATEKIICGGDTIAEVEKMKMTKRMTFISTGGGAALDFLAGKKLPAIEALNRKN